MSADLVINLSSLEAEHANTEFSELLGYERVDECLKAMKDVVHFSGHSFWHLAQLERESCLPSLMVMDRHQRLVGNVARLKADKSSHTLTVEVSEITETPRLAYFLVDTRTRQLDQQQGLAETIVQFGDWQDKIWIEDAPTISALLSRKNMPAADTFYYEIVTTTGSRLRVRHEVHVVRRLADGLILENHIFQCPVGEAVSCRLSHLGFLESCEVDQDASVTTAGLREIRRFMASIRLAFPAASLSVSARLQKARCSGCSWESGADVFYPVFSWGIEDQQADVQWQQLLSNLHAAGFHFGAEIPNGDDRVVHLYEVENHG